MTKDIHEIERLLREEKLPDQDTSQVKAHVWKKILEDHRKRQKQSLLLRIKPWFWSLASILLIILCILIMWFVLAQNQ